MRLTGSMDLGEIRAALNDAARDAWSESRLIPLKRVIDMTAAAMHAVLQESVSPLDADTDAPGAAIGHGDRAE